MRCGCWNVENLFDTVHAEGFEDWDFLPDGANAWNSRRYWGKLHRLSKVIAAMSEDFGPPVFLGLCEVEGDSCLRDFTRRSALRHLGYDYVVAHGPDARGVQTALIYQPQLFRVVASQSVRVPSREHHLRATRDILYVKGVLFSGDTLHLAVVHFPSRRGGSREADRHRMLAASVLRHLADSLSTSCFMAMGDFNAYPSDPVFRRMLTDASSPLRTAVTTKKKRLRGPEGTYCYRGEWGYLDHILVTEPFRRMLCGEALPFKREFMLTPEGLPLRSFQGPVWRGGYSDHLPLAVEFTVP